MNLAKILNDCFTGPDGKTIAIGRVYSLPVLVVGLAIPIVQVLKGQAVSLTDLGVMFGGLGAGVMLFIRGTNGTEPPPAPPAAASPAP